MTLFTGWLSLHAFCWSNFLRKDVRLLPLPHQIRQTNVRLHVEWLLWKSKWREESPAGLLLTDSSGENSPDIQYSSRRSECESSRAVNGVQAKAPGQLHPLHFLQSGGERGRGGEYWWRGFTTRTSHCRKEVWWLAHSPFGSVWEEMTFHCVITNF